MAGHARAAARAEDPLGQQLERRMVPTVIGPVPGEGRRGAAAEARPRGRETRTRGQAVLEFALVAPVLMVLALGVVDFGRVYASAVTVEAAAREAADFGSWHLNESDWQSEARRRACSAALPLDGYVGADDGATCSNPAVELFSNETTASGVPIVRARLTYDFETTLQLPFLPLEIILARDSRFAEH